ncbi:TetR/AcrR family transcriptional regulator [Streptomyces thermolineatus]|uniref:TetR/AcrR family transcriptional regulator n=1 Tax=Streptomyces thermolineatus TaxID=44033 RepID=UPI00384C89D7
MRADARRNHDALLAAARAAFAEHGVDAPLDDIARAAGVGNATLYRHFPTRQALIEAVLHDSLEELSRRAAESAAGEPDTRAALLDWLRALLAHSTTYRGLSAELVAGTKDPRSGLNAACTAMQEQGTRLLERARRAGTVRADITADELFALVSGVGWAADRAPGAQDRLFAVLADGLRPPAPAPAAPGSPPAGTG